MSNAHSNRPLAASPKRPRADFNWPPTEDEMGEYATNLAQSETVLDECELEAWRFIAEPAQSTGEDQQPSAIEASTTPATGSVPAVSASDGTNTREWAGEIARLQALIKGLTDKV